MDSGATEGTRALGLGPGNRPLRLAESAVEPGAALGCSSLAEAAPILARQAGCLVIAEWTVGDEAMAERLRAASASGGPDARWVLLAEGHADVSVLREWSDAGFECWPASTDDETLVAMARRLIREVEAASENRFLRETIRIMEDCRSLAHSLEPTQLYPMCLDLVLQATRRARGLTVFRRREGAHGDAFALRGFDDEESARLSRALLADSRIDLDLFEGVSVLGEGVFHEVLDQADFSVTNLLVVSFGGEGRQSGVVVILDDGRDYTPADVERADIVARHGISALANAGTYATAKDRAFVDDVTTAYNARYLLETVENEIQRADRYGHPLSILFLDLDHFKKVNDSHGHLAGSEALRALCRLLERCVRNVDTLARYGGDEFTIVLVDTDHEAALQVAERIRQTVERQPFELEAGLSLFLTLCIGVSTYPQDGTCRDDLLEAADQAMYRAKAAGRNRTESASNSAD